MTRLCAIIITYNEAEHIAECLKALEFADTRVVFDSFSTDNTTHIAESMGVRVIQRPFDNFANQRNAALQAVAEDTDWVLFVDADERVTPELAQEVRQVIADSECVGWRIPRWNYLFGVLTKGAGWYPDYQTRLLKIGKTRYDTTRQVHEVVLLDGAEGTMNHHFIHYNYKDLAQFIRKQQKYVVYDAQILFEQEVHPRPQNYVLQPLRHFWWRFITLKGFRDGWHGFRLSVIMAWYEFRKYWILRRLWR